MQLGKNCAGLRSRRNSQPLGQACVGLACSVVHKRSDGLLLRIVHTMARVGVELGRKPLRDRPRKLCVTSLVASDAAKGSPNLGILGALRLEQSERSAEGFAHASLDDIFYGHLLRTTSRLGSALDMHDEDAPASRNSIPQTSCGEADTFFTTEHPAGN